MKRLPVILIAAAALIALGIYLQKASASSKAVAAAPQDLKDSDQLVAWFCLGNGRPQKGFLYSLTGMRVVEKISEGYVMIPSDAQGQGYIRPALVYAEDSREIHGTFPKASFVGEVEYRTQNGFIKQAYGFKLTDK